jgi:hypothetical protein
MRKMTLLLALFASFTFYEANAQTSANVSNDAGTKIKINGPAVKLDKLSVDCGNIEKGIPKTADFLLTNDGNEPLIIASAVASCGCTNLKYDKEPILPGKTSTISATYNAVAPGPFMKSITLKTNAGDQSVVLQIKGTVVEKKN